MPPSALLDTPRKGALQILAYFYCHHQGQCKEIELATGLSRHTVRRRIGELKESGILGVSQTKTFPSMRRYTLVGKAEEIAHTAASMLKGIRNHAAEEKPSRRAR